MESDSDGVGVLPADVGEAGTSKLVAGDGEGTLKPGVDDNEGTINPGGSDGGEEGTLEPEYAPMGMPSLVKQLRVILSEYPDGGQIIKELLQNAEDAEASEVKLLFDARRINREPCDKEPFRRFFMAPALCVYNNAMFSDEDWRGIQMVHSSVKEEDRLKVGRFGLGFKSVFHITDYPCIISGDRLLMIDHQQSPYQVNATLRLKILKQYKGMNVATFLKAFSQTFGFSEQNLAEGFNGTILWFPLRETPSDLSDTIYSAEKISRLFDAISGEASSLLVFLKNVTSMAWYERDRSLIAKQIGKTELIENAGEVDRERKSFQKKVKELKRDFDGEALRSSFVMVVMTTIEEQPPQIMRWMVVNYFMGGNASAEFRALIQNESVGYSPYVGVAAPIGQIDDNFTGHIFCFLPVPREGSSLTNLPIHVNGFFAMSQNRHHLKWATEEQEMQKVDDKSILWNQKLVTECLPLAYEHLLRKAIEYSAKNENTSDMVNSIYAAIPDTREVLDKWKDTASATLERVKKDPLVYRQETDCESGDWIPVTEARFATLENLSDQYKQAIVKLLGLFQENFVDISKQLFDKLNAAFDETLEDLTPERLRLLMKQNDTYMGISAQDKLYILTYLLSDNCYNEMEGLQLLPLASGEWQTFSSQAIPVYICKEEDMSLFPRCEHRILKMLPDHLDELADHLKAMGKHGYFQLRKLSPEAAKGLIRDVINDQIATGDSMYVQSSDDIFLPWLKQVWQFIFDHKVLDEFLDVPILPVVKQGNWPCPHTVELVRLKDTLILQKSDANFLPDAITSALEMFKVTVIRDLPKWIPQSNVEAYMNMPDCSSVLKLLSKQVNLADGTSVRESFNANCPCEIKDGLFAYLCNVPGVDSSTKNCLRQLKICKEGHGPSSDVSYVSISDNDNFTTNQTFPVNYPKPLILATETSAGLLKILGGQPVEYNELILQTLNQMQRSQYDKCDVKKFMWYFIENSDKFVDHANILESAKRVAFLETSTGEKMPSELFNPTEDILKALFQGEESFPTIPNINESKVINGLKRLGLKEIRNISQTDLLETAKILHSRSNTGDMDVELDEKAAAFVRVLTENKSGIDLKEFGSKIAGLQCIKCVTTRDKTFPEFLPWFPRSPRLYTPTEVKHMSHARLVGSIMPLVSIDGPVSEIFSWNTDPPLQAVLQQLSILKEHYKTAKALDILFIMEAIYQYMSRHMDELNQLEEQLTVIWTGEEFHAPSVTVIQASELDLKPYVFQIPSVFDSFEQLFKQLGCIDNLTVDVYIETLTLIQKDHTGIQCETDFNQGFELVQNILQVLSKDVSIIVGRENDILIPIQAEDDNSLVMKPLSQCTYDEHSCPVGLDDDEENEYYVHEKIPLSVVRALGIKSTNKKALSAMEDFGVGEEWGQDEPLTTRLRTLLKDGYTDGLSVPKELIQNADDAAATEVKILYDERGNIDKMNNLLSPGMKGCQGPALWVYNDAVFTDADMANITKLNGGTKENDARKIGKFGLGFCSVYNLTDVPSFISRGNIVVFDPHRTYLGEALPGISPGLKIDMSRKKNELLIKRRRDQFAPYQDVFGCDILGLNEFNGTLFRFPLRNHEQAQNSKISSICYSKHEVYDLLSLFMKTAGNMFLFTQNVKSVEIYHLPSSSGSPKNPITLFSMSKTSYSLQDSTLQPLQENVLARITNTDSNGFAEMHTSDITIDITDEAKHIIPALKDQQSSSKTSWLCSWADISNRSESTSSMMEKEGAYPLSAVSIPCSITMSKLESLTEKTSLRVMPIDLKSIESGFSTAGTVFCFLPMPLQTALPFHINGCFDVTSDRRQLIRLTEDDKSTDRERWNHGLMSDSLVNAFIHLLLFLSESVNDNTYVYHSLWPLYVQDIIKPFQESFYRTIVDGNMNVFKSRNQHWVSFGQLVFLDPMLRDNSRIGEIAVETLTHFAVRGGKILVDIPTGIVRMLERIVGKEEIGKSMVKEEEMAEIFLNNINDVFWTSNIAKRNEMILFILQSGNRKIQQIMGRTRCIPIAPSGDLQRPEYLINPTAAIARLFHVSDGRFPLDTPAFGSPETLSKLCRLGMMTTTLPGHLLIDRCKSVDVIARECCACAHERCRYILEYINSGQDQSTWRSAEGLQTLNAIKETHIIPVMARPPDWKFSWKTESCSSLMRHHKSDSCNRHSRQKRTELVLGRPSDVYRNDVFQYIGSVKNVTETTLSQSMITNDAFNILGIKGRDPFDIEITLLVDQLMVCSQEFKCSEQRDNAATILEITATHLDRVLMKEEGQSTKAVSCIKRIFDMPLILFGESLVKPSQVVFSVRKECHPYLYQLGSREQRNRRFYECIGVQECFPPATIVDALSALKEIKCPFDEVYIDKNNDLLIDLEESLTLCKQTYTDLESVREQIVAPDIHGVAWATHKLVIDDEEFETSDTMHVLHSRITPGLAKCFGVKSKQRHKFSEMRFGIPFGQKEELVTRINGLLKSYPCDAGIMKELLQNADDAGATEIHFIKDFRNHSKKAIFGESCGLLQEPALCVFNDSYFRKEDFEGIHNLGIGSKSDNPTKTGQYGVGFNAVYHLTDLPSFLTKGPEIEDGGALCIFDPLCEHIPDVEKHEPGVKCTFDEVKQSFPDVLLGFLENEQIWHNGKGTLFRLPLRSKGSDLKSKDISPTDVDTMLSEMMDEMLVALIFVKNVNTIRVSNISDGTLTEEYAVHITMGNDEIRKRNHFVERMNTVVVKSKQQKEVLLVEEPFEVGYEMTVEDTENKRHKWYVVQRFGLDKNEGIPDIVTKAFQRKEIGTLPIGGVAVPLKDGTEQESCTNETASVDSGVKEKARQFKAFCFLPLPLVTGLPVHLNGHFALDHESRRDLWKSDENEADSKAKWNECLMKQVITPAYMTALHFIGRSYIDGSHVELQRLLDSLDYYHEKMPIYKEALGPYWKLLITTLYKRITSEGKTFFPVIHKSKQDTSDGLEPNAVFNNEWVAVTEDFRHDCGVFDDTVMHVQKGNTDNMFSEGDKGSIVTVLKNIGVKMIQTPLRIHSSMADSGLDVSTSTPDNVVMFLKGIQDRDSTFSCIGGLDKPLDETTIGDTDSLRSLIKYMKLGNLFQKHIDILPILLTNDDCIRLFSKQAPVFHTRFCDLLPYSAARFVHRRFLSLYPKAILCERKVCLEFDIHKFESLLGETLDPGQYRVDKRMEWSCTEDSAVIPNVQWINEVWSFVVETSDYQNDSRAKAESLQKSISTLSQWSLLPSIVLTEHQCIHRLIPVSEMYTLLDLTSFYKRPKVRQVITDLAIPSLDCKVLSDKCTAAFISHGTMATYDRPCEVLKCLHYHRGKIANSTISSNGSIMLLEYISSHIELITKSADTSSLRTKLVSLPLYITQQNTRIKLNRNRRMIVLPGGVPEDGMDEFAQNLGILFLKSIFELRDLYRFLSLGQMNQQQLYAEEILPNMKYLDRCHWMRHIEYVRDILLSKSVGTDYDRYQTKLIELLKKIPFINVNGQMKLCSELYTNTSEVFRVMCEPGSFPPPEFCSKPWLSFLSLLGMPTQVTDDHLLRFAEQISDDGRGHMTDRVKLQSRCLRRHFLQRISNWKEGTTRRIGLIKFILPSNVPTELVDIYQQTGNVDSFVRFCDCVHTEHMKICWSTIHLLHEKEIIPDRQMQFLGIDNIPNIKCVIQHLQNISTELETHVLNGQVDTEIVEEIMAQIYMFLKAQTVVDQDVSQRLESFPIIFLKEHNKLVTVKDVVLTISEQEKVPPYLYAAPVYFGQYHGLFAQLGVSEQVQCFHYSRILERVHRDSQNNPLDVQELHIVRKAISNLVGILQSHDRTVDFGDISLYLPNAERVLVNANLLTISTNQRLEQRLMSLDDIVYFLGFKQLEIQLHQLPSHFLNKIPEQWRPRFLEDDIREVVSTEDVERVTDSIKASQLQHFMHSPYVLQGICRILKQHCRDNNMKFDVNSCKESMKQKLLKVRVWEVTGLKTYILYRGNRVERSGRTKYFHTEEKLEGETTIVYLYFVNSEESHGYSEHTRELVKFFKNLAGVSSLKHGYAHLYSMLGNVDRPEDIPEELNKLKVDRLDSDFELTGSIFPRPGTYVEERFYPFLEQSMTLFEKHEYRSLALEVESREIDDDDWNAGDGATGVVTTARGSGSVYIYVHILREIKPDMASRLGSVIFTRYLVDTGSTDGNLSEFPAYRLYRFVRRTEEVGTELVPHDTEAVGTVPFDENCKRVRQMLIEAWTLTLAERKRIIRRLLMKWHPDRNKGGNEEYANRIFNYIKCLMLQLEAEETVSEHVDNNTGRRAPDMSGSMFRGMTRRVDERAPVIDAAYWGNLNHYRTPRWKWTHYHAERVIRPDIEEAMRWIRQAKLDFRAALQFLSLADDVDGYNWICYTCHQACEKAMKAAMFAKDANSVSLRTHSLEYLGQSLSPQFEEQARLLHARLGEHTRMRYPNIADRPDIPSDIFTEDHAKSALEIAEKVIELADERME